MVVVFDHHFYYVSTTIEVHTLRYLVSFCIFDRSLYKK